MEQSIIVFYHDLCMDGFAAAAIMYQYTNIPDFIPVNYRAMPDLEGNDKKVLAFLDFTPPVEWVKKNIDKISSLTILDHHADKEQDCEEIKSIFPGAIIHFDTSLSGAGLTWKWTNSKPMPEVVRLINDRDLWIASDQEREFHELFVHYLKKGNKDEIFPPFIELINYTEEEVKTILRPQVDLLIKARDKNLDFHIDKVKILDLCFAENTQQQLKGRDIKVAYLSAPYYYISEAADRLMKKFPDVDLVVNVTLNNRGLGFSFRSSKGTGLAQLAGHLFEGGGHPDAAGGKYDHPVSFETINTMLRTGLKDRVYIEYLSQQFCKTVKLYSSERIADLLGIFMNNAFKEIANGSRNAESE